MRVFQDFFLHWRTKINFPVLKTPIHVVYAPILLFDDNKIKMARKPEKKQKENPVGCTEEGKI